MSRLPRLTVPLTDGELHLRPFDLADVTAVTEACQDPEISRWTATIPFPYSEEDARSWISTHGDLWSTGQAAQFAITTATDALLGNIGIQPIDWGNRSAVVGYWVAAWARRRGVATRALQLAIPWALRDVGLVALDLQTKVGNVASERVAEKAGFTLMAEVEDYEYPPGSGQRHHVKRWHL